MEHSNSTDKNNRLRRENEEKKKRLEEQFGADYWYNSDESTFSPEIESQFLDHIMAFENAFQSSKQIKLYDFLEQPAFRKVEELTNAEVTEELSRIMELMNKKMVYLDTICEVDDSELYRFITEELFFEEKDDIPIPGMITHYTYEEFHPNHEHDIRNHSIDFVRSFLDKESGYYTTFMTGEAEKADWHLHFREAFSFFHLNDFIIKELEFDTEKARVQFDCDFVGEVEGSEKSLHFLGAGELMLLYQWDFWCVDKINFPKSTVC